jgi:hypothetical protein
VAWIGLSVLRALSIGLCGCASNGPVGEAERAMLMP